MASIAPKTPTTPSYFPEYGIASIWEPVATAASSGSWPSLHNKIMVLVQPVNMCWRTETLTS